MINCIMKFYKDRFRLLKWFLSNGLSGKVDLESYIQLKKPSQSE